MVSRRLQETLEAAAAGDAVDAELVEQARTELYRGQCNCGYWHGAFGGIYLPHLRNAVYQHLIAADNLLDQAIGPARELDRSRGRRLQLRRPPGSPPGQRQAAGPGGAQPRRAAARTRRPPHPPQPAGHAWPAGPRPITARCWPASTSTATRWPASTTAWSSSRPTSTSGCNTTTTPRKSLLDLFYDNDATLEAVAAGTAPQRGDFVDGLYEARIRRNPDRIQVQLIREGTAGGVPVRITKGLTLDAGSSTLQDRLPAGEPAHRPAAALRRRVELRRPARRRRRPLLPATSTANASASSARSSICRASSAWACATSGWGSTWA